MHESNPSPRLVPAAQDEPRRAARLRDARALRREALAAWRLEDPDAKCAATLALHALAGSPVAGAAAVEAPDEAAAPTECVQARASDERPGRPAQPVLVMPREVRARPVSTPEGRAALMHAIAHIEFNAIDLALDAVWRFDGLPLAYRLDWLAVAADEARHFGLVRALLQARGHDYGDFPAHDGLWQMAARTAHDVMARMALVPGVLEARGLDATPPMQARLLAVGDHEAVAALQVILDEEVGHVATGRRWFRFLCEREGADPRTRFLEIFERWAAPAPKAPMNRAARKAAGFTDEELDALVAPR